MPNTEQMSDADELGARTVQGDAGLATVDMSKELEVDLAYMYIFERNVV